MPEPVRGDQKYLLGLDGLRALAVAAVVVYHLGFGWDKGGRLRLRDFWQRRARRLLPALFVMLAVVGVWMNTVDRAELPGFRGDVIASMFYVSNWWYIG